MAELHDDFQPRISPSAPSYHLYTIPIQALEEHIRARHAHLGRSSPEEQMDIQREIDDIQKHIDRRNQEQLQQLAREYSTKSTVTAGDYNSYPSFHTPPRRYGSSSSNDGLMQHSGWFREGMATGAEAGVDTNSRKRFREFADLGGDDGFRLETKSPRFMPSPFVNVSIAGSPNTNGNAQNGTDIGRMLTMDGAPSPYTQQLLADEQLARSIQESYDNGFSPNFGIHRGIGTNHSRLSAALTPTRFGNNHYAMSSELDELPSDDSDGILPIGDNQDFAGSLPTVKVEPDYGPATLINWPTIDPAQEGLNLLDWIDMPVGREGSGVDPFDQQPSVLLKAEDLQPSLNLPNPHQIVDASGNVLLNGSWEVPGGLNKLSGAVRNYVDYVSNDPTKSLAEIKSLLQNIRPDMEIPKEEREGTPEAMLYPLMEHQKVGLTWLKKMEEGPTKGGILADDMGLGKTIQTLALLVSRPSQDEKRKTTLVVTPVAVLKQWEKEIKKKLKNDHQLSVCIYHCQGKKIKSFADLAQYDVVLTTFGTIASEYKRKEIYLRNMTAGNAGPEPAQIILGKASKFYRVVIDEAQWIKNRDTQSSKGCYSIDAQYRLCLSGTPMQNSCDELFSLLRFLRIKPYNEWSTFAETFSRPLKQKSNYSANQAMSKLQALLKAILLRRTKDSTIDGQPILALPPKEIVMVHAVFSQDEKEFYDALESKSKIQFNKYLRQNAVGRNYSNLLVLLLRLRQACCHPHLINDIEEAKDEGDRDEILNLVRQLSPEVVRRIKQSESLECPVCLDVSDNPSIVIPCGHLFCKECLLQVQTQHEQSNLARGDDNSKLRCPGCRGELDPKRITSLSSFKMVHPPEGDDADRGASGLRRDSDDDLIYDSDSEDDEERDADEYGNLKNSVIPDDAGYGDHPAPKLAAKSKGKGKQKAGRTLAEVRKDAMRNEKSKQLYHKYLQKRWVDSAKVAKCMELLERIQQAHPQEKTIVFSQFTSLLDFLEIPISRKSIEYRRYDGGMSSTKRNQSINDFIDDADVKVLLVSLKAGNSGLNLAVASQVIIFDPFYNPYIELQAIDRAHRIGQQRRVVVHRLVVAGTVEDRVLALQEKKKALIEGALDENAQRGLGRLTAKDLGFLFGIGSN